MVSVQARKEQARYAIERGLSQRRACTLLNTSRSNLSYKSTMSAKEAPIIEAMKTLSGTYPRFGSRRLRVFLQRIGLVLGKEKCRRLWAKAGLQVPKKRRRKVAVQKRRLLAPTERNSVGSYDFVYDACANGQKLKCLTVVDEYTRECLAIDVSRTIRSKRVIKVLTRLMTIHGVPRYLRSDYGPEFVSQSLLQSAAKEPLE